MPNPERPSVATADLPAERPRGFRRPLVLAAALAFLTLAAFPLAGATALGSVAPEFGTAAGTTPTASWAWGAAENASAHVAYVGAYTASLNLSGGNLTKIGAYVAVNESFSAGYLAYAMVNVTSPSSSARSVEAAAVELRSVQGAIGIAGTLPVAGTYAPGAYVPLAPTTSALWLSEGVANAYLAFANYTVGPNGSLSLANEHVEVWEAINVSLVASNFPNSTLDANGSTTVKYVTASVNEAGWVGENLTASFSPALLVSEAPLSVGESWNASTQATFVGTAAYASAITGSSNGTTISVKNAGAASLNASVPLTFEFTVTGKETLGLPNGTTETGYTVAYSQGGSSCSYRVFDGLVVLPSSDGTKAGGLQPETPVRPASAPLEPSAAPVTRAVVARSEPLPIASESHPSNGPALLAAPVSTATAQAEIHHTGTPSLPALPTPSTGRASGASALLPLLLLGGLVVVVGGFFVLEARRARPRA
ncbi:MAG: hypothetical protein L3K13_05480 [Thermoplasmata archaeon]|nr:hypothetical protein [Thermoplasmata archaeon]